MAYNIQKFSKTLILLYATNPTTIASVAAYLNGLCRGIVITAPALETSHTYTINIKDAAGNVVYTKAALVQNTVTQIYLYDANNALVFPLSGDYTIEIVTSGSQTADRTFTVALLIER